MHARETRELNDHRRSGRAAWLVSILALLLATLALHQVRDALDKAHVALVLLLVVLGGSAAGGRVLGVVLALAGFVVFDLFFLPPFNTLVVADPLDWLVLVVFLATGVVAAQLLTRAQREADEARRRSEEVAALTAQAQTDAAHAAALREADQLKDALLATVSHDLRTPLTTIRGLAHDIVRDGDDRALAIEEEVERLNRLVTDLLDLSRLKAGGVPLALALNTADELMGATLQRVSGAATGRDIRASLDPNEPLLVGTFDLTHSVRILGNLLENALKYAPDNAPIDFTVVREGPMLAFRVADRGPGIADEERERIFTPFHRATSARPDVGSVGLGLAIARGLADAQGGSLQVTPRDGGGSVFTLHLPAADLIDTFETR
ncbi:MAG TPA: DUF4118 domain-containing protein [Gemmatimonas aurantiaca]|uniref:histidine kinase n=2 Tax=Gemmatimonas aurantiaca TaxID=173480 RepID=C1ABQ3_GEMAT|nr:ATP-binding protein [Gemmatimonas aurantiaca]BAH39930.1 two-component histidine kinase [Gemmatimonas aurantiaca T-27]HCT58059.1 DUF4118 domain-containing protein [Gemmatimonas aurantiaca]